MNYNLILYIGLFLIVGSFIGFILNEMHKRKKDIELFRQHQLTKSFKKEKLIALPGRKLKILHHAYLLKTANIYD